ncbi:MAG: hypothetical protein JWO67_16 [Streptosporangiaceae bacterium]|nr:hypothetical protein [Streptosporangiaceae bacterium]
MTINSVTTILGALIGVAMVTTIVRSPNTAPVVKAFGDAFSGSINAAMGAGIVGK